MAFTNRYRPDLPAGPVQDAFDAIYAQLRAFFRVSFNEDGTLIPAPPNVGVSPIGSIQMYGGSTAPANWLMCDGSAVSRVTYKDLFAVVGTTFGVGDGSTTFNLPDLRQRFPLGKAAAGTGATLGSTGGNIDHSHSGGSITGSTGAATATISGSTGSAAPGTDSQGSHNHGGATGSHTHTFTTSDGSAGGLYVNVTGGAGNLVSIKDHFHTGTTDGSTASISSDGSHSHTVNAHSHTAGTLGVDAHSHSAGTLAQGTTGTANPPYQVVNYIILAGV